MEAWVRACRGETDYYVRAGSNPNPNPNPNPNA